LGKREDGPRPAPAGSPCDDVPIYSIDLRPRDDAFLRQSLDQFSIAHLIKRAIERRRRLAANLAMKCVRMCGGTW
jgi:hypothetical protein